MEENLLNQFKQIAETENVTGCVLADSQGLCLLSTQNLRPESAGLVSAITQHAIRIDAENKNPVIYLESASRKCLIQNEGDITTAIFMSKIIHNAHT
uniref:Late endosomal/lysosomal adaptor and MAPK and MTOR activator 5 n=1 Tax=Triatoma infestans TaxID=30076 RepID=A0A023EYW9_TRIIF